MTSKRKRTVAMVLLSVVGGALGIFVLASAKTNSRPAVLKTRVVVDSSRKESTGTAERTGGTAVKTTYVHPGRLITPMRWQLDALGDRLEKPGRERVTLQGNVIFAGASQHLPITLVWELPGRLFIALQRGADQRTLTFDGEKVIGNRQIDSPEHVLLETLFYDGAERFFTSQMGEATSRHLGSNFRTDDGTTADYAGPFYDIYQLTDTLRTGSEVRRQSKLYLFNSQTKLLEYVRYTLMRDGQAVNVEVQMTDWRRVQGQQVPRRIKRLENGSSVFDLTITTVAHGPRLADEIFGTP